MTAILIVDDAATVRLYHRTILEAAGYRADEAVNGVEALEKALGAPYAPYALYLVDVNMPQLDGYGFLRALRSLAIEQAPAIMVTSEAQEHDRRQAYIAGANLYLVKPAHPAALLEQVRLMLGEQA